MLLAGTQSSRACTLIEEVLQKRNGVTVRVCKVRLACLILLHQTEDQKVLIPNATILMERTLFRPPR